MTTQSLEQIAARPVAGRIGQATSIEQSRAVAEVQAAVFVAQQFPRNVPGAYAAMTEACQSKILADHAFFSFPRADQTVAGESIHLARELARCWTNIDYGIEELSRDDDAGESEMKAWAWDMQTNTRVSNTFIVKHIRDTQKGPKKLVDLRDIYENNANNGARRMRECIFGVLPRDYINKAKELCMATLKNGGGVPLAQRIAQAVTAFGQLGVTREQLEEKRGRSSKDWTDLDMAQLQILYTSLKNGEIDRDETFPVRRVTAEEIGSTPAAAAPKAERSTSTRTAKRGAAPTKITADGLQLLDALFNTAEIVDSDDRLTYASTAVGHDVGALNGLSPADAETLAQKLESYIAQQQPPADEPGDGA